MLYRRGGTLKGERFWYPLIWSDNDYETTHIAYLDNERVAHSLQSMLNTFGLSASVAPPVRLSIFQTYLPDLT